MTTTSSQTASYPIESWGKVNEYITDLLNKVKDMGATLRQRDDSDLDQSEVKKNYDKRTDFWHAGGHLSGDVKARKFDKDAPHYTTTEDCSLPDLPKKWKEYLDDLEKYFATCWDEVNTCWENEYQKQLQSPKTLYDKGEKWKDIKSSEMDNLTEDVGKMQLQTSWTGAGAEAYGKAISVQTEAFTKISELVGSSSKALHQGSSGLQRFYLSVAQSAIQMKSEMDACQPPTKEDIGYHLRNGIAILRNCKDYFAGDLKEGIRTWSQDVQKGTDTLNDSIANEKPFTGAEWPKIDGDLSDMEPGPSTPSAQTPSVPTTPDVDPDVDGSDTPVTPDGYDSSDTADAGYQDSKL